MIIEIKNPGNPLENQDMSFQVYRALQNAPDGSALVFEKGTYHFFPEFAAETLSCVSNHDNDGYKKTGFSLQGRKDITIDGGGSDFIFHGIMLPFFISGCKNICIQNVAVDFPESMYGAAKVLQNGDGFTDMRILEGTRYRVERGCLLIQVEGSENPVERVMEIDPERGDIAYESNDGVFGDWFRMTSIQAEDLGDRTVRFSGGNMTRQPKEGNFLLLGSGKRFAPGFFIEGSENIALEDVTIYNCLGMGVLAQLSKDVALRRLRVVPKEGRLISCYADGTHFVNCAGEILLEGCTIQNQMDDALNCHGIYGQIAKKVDEKTLLVRLVHDQQLGVPIFAPGDRIEWIDHDSLLTRGTGEIEGAVLYARNMFLLTFRERVPEEVRELDCIENTKWCPDLTVRGCYIGKNRARGILITTRGKVVVEDNTFDANGAAIKISGDANYWFESGCVRDVTIRNNLFTDCNRSSWWGKAVIDIDPEIKTPNAAEGCYHQNITIAHNTFRTFDTGLLWAKSVENLIFRENEVIRTKTYPPKGKVTEKITLCACKNAVIEE